MSLQSENRHRGILVGRIIPFLSDGRVLRQTCRLWRSWIPSGHLPSPQAHVPVRVALRDDQIDHVVEAMRRLRLPWSDATDRYLRTHLQRIPCVHEDGSDFEALTDHLGRLYQRAVLPPKTNIGTLGSYVVERKDAMISVYSHPHEISGSQRNQL